MRRELHATSRIDLLQRLADPPKKFRPSTNMNSSGKMIAVNLAYKDRH